MILDRVRTGPCERGWWAELGIRSLFGENLIGGGMPVGGDVPGTLRTCRVSLVDHVSGV